MEFVVKKTTELKKDEIKRILFIFQSVFEHERTEEYFLNEFLNTELGYSLHLLMLDNGVIVGSHTYVPCYFIIDGKKLKFTYGADTMVLKGHRDIFTYMDMLSFGRKYLKDNGFVVDYGYPNEMNHAILIKGKLSKDVGMMHIYCLPYRLGGIKKGLGFMNWASKAFCWVWYTTSNLLASRRVVNFRISKDLPSYNESRYKRAFGDYAFGDGFVYKITEFDGIRAVFIIDVFEKSEKNFCKAVGHLLKKESKNFDALLYPGVLPFACCGMVKLPRKIEPKHFFMTCKVLNKKELPIDALYDINNWDTNLSNYDLI